MTPSDRSSGPAAGEATRRRYDRALRVGLAVSAVLHVIALGLAGDWIRPDPSPRSEAAPVAVRTPAGLQAVELAEPETDEDAGVAVPVPPRRPAPSPETEAGREADDVVVPDRPAVADARSAADRLAPQVVDPRLWRPMVLLPREPTIDDVEARIGAAVELLSDSALAEAERAIRARDWTVEDEEGGRWGISPGKLHLGSVTLPLPIWFPVDPTAAAEAERWYELERGLDRTRILDSFEDRVRAIRERRDRERAENRDGERGGS